MGPESRPVRRADVLAQGAGDTVILLTPDSGEYFTLNDVGGRIWELADGSRTAADVADSIAAEYDAPPEEIRADVFALLGQLTEARLVDDAQNAA